ncbi:hypothetical protein NLG97_g10066 [Lecanicillium saksenae]|uniref:Uncharacterized protein n=1 Tax=Lecanicillium saksenae TaxID=468837 RepID=A0ACC1QHF7_9HYPO|nr:hypothetical protein NLG97_g10066 [Lecanicillium saksenae]
MASILSGISSFIFGGNPRAAEISTNVQLVVDEPETTPAVEDGSQTRAAVSTQPTTLPSRDVFRSQPPQNPFLNTSWHSFGQSGDLPPPYRSRDSNSQLPEDGPDVDDAVSQLTPFEQRIRLSMMHISSLPEYRWDEQVATEKTRLVEKWKACNLRPQLWLEAEELTSLASSIVRRRWLEQGLIKEPMQFWLPRDQTPTGFWPHQGIREGHRPHQVRRLDSSRPFFQFMHEVAAERDHLEFLADPPRLPAELTTHEVDPNPEAVPDDLHTKAYCNVRYEQWEPQGIWDERWGEGLPGMFWKHERHICEVFMEEFGSEEGIGSRCRELSDALPDRSSFRRRRIAIGRYFSADIQNILRMGEPGGEPPLGEPIRYSPDTGYVSQYAVLGNLNPAPEFPRQPPLVPGRDTSGRLSSGLFQSSLEVADPARNTAESLSTRGIFGGDPPRRCLFSGAILEDRAAEESRLSTRGS